MTCRIVTTKGDQVTYGFTAYDANNFAEVSYSKNGWSPAGHNPLWRLREGATWEITPVETPDYTLSVTKDNNSFAQLFHAGRVVGTGSCWAGLPAEAIRPAAPAAPVAPPVSRNVVTMQVAQGENWIAAKFGAHPDLFWGILDTGATLVSIPEPAANLLVEAGEAHWTGETHNMVTADGARSPSRMLIVHRMTIGSQTVTNVEASTAPAGAPFLLGMSVLGRMGPMRLDVAAGQVVFG
jgi:hypothetical protein